MLVLIFSSGESSKVVVVCWQLTITVIIYFSKFYATLISSESILVICSGYELAEEKKKPPLETGSPLCLLSYAEKIKLAFISMEWLHTRYDLANIYIYIHPYILTYNFIYIYNYSHYFFFYCNFLKTEILFLNWCILMLKVNKTPIFPSVKINSVNTLTYVDNILVWRYAIVHRGPRRWSERWHTSPIKKGWRRWACSNRRLKSFRETSLRPFSI